jgi:hypothetical protein
VTPLPPGRFGSLLVLGLPPDEFGWPYQAITRLAPGGRTSGLYRDEDGGIWAWRNTPEGRPVPAMQRLPEEAQAAARQWEAERRPVA